MLEITNTIFTVDLLFWIIIGILFLVALVVIMFHMRSYVPIENKFLYLIGLIDAEMTNKDEFLKIHRLTELHAKLNAMIPYLNYNHIYVAKIYLKNIIKTINNYERI